MDMSNQLVIVALPSDEDPVRKISSETEPHLTLLYLGDPGFDSSQLDLVAGYIEHASSMLTPFNMFVESRGLLGDQSADVLFFKDRWSKTISEFRHKLLQNDLVSEAFLSTDQFPEWTPHLTLGFPATPAKNNAEYPSISSVYFDRIALWTGNYTGPTFQLKYKDYDMDVAMSQVERGRYAVENVLAHHGVKGMKWGVRRTQAELDSASGRSVSADFKSASESRSKIEVGGTQSLSNHELQGLINRMNLERQYHQMTSQNQNEIDRGLKSAQRILKTAKTVEEARKFMQTPTGKALTKGLKTAFAAAKVAAAAQSGGASAAAGAGASIVVRRMANHYTNVG